VTPIPRVVEHHVEAAELVACAADQILDGSCFTDIGRDERRTDVVCDLLAFAAAEIAEDDLGAFLREQFRSCFSDSRSAARDNRDPTGEFS